MLCDKCAEGSQFEAVSDDSSFGQMLHYAMVLEPFMVATEKEIEYVERYVSLQQMRFDRKLNMVYEIAPESSDFKIPKMSVQPLVENA